MTGFVAHHPRAAGAVLSVVGVLLGAALVLACAAAVGGCGSAWQTAASATAIAAIEMDRGTTQAYKVIAHEAMDTSVTLEDWCETMAPHWERAARAECAAVALADLALTAQSILDAGENPGLPWAGAVCGATSAAMEIWGQVEEPPRALGKARGLACALAGSYAAPEPECEIGPVPGCEDVEGE